MISCTQGHRSLRYLSGRLNSRPRPYRALAQSGDDSEKVERNAADAGVFYDSLNRAAKAKGLSSQPNNTNMFMIAGSEEEWRRIDKKVNQYPCQRSFSAIGTCINGGSEFQNEMVAAVGSIVGSIHLECISQRSSRQGKYLSVRIGPVWVQSGDEVIAIYSELKKRGEAMTREGKGELKYLL